MNAAQVNILHWTRKLREAEEASEEAKIELARAEGKMFAVRELQEELLS